MKRKSESKGNLEKTEEQQTGDIEKGQGDFNIIQQDEYILSEIEKQFILAADRGDCPGVRRIIEENKDNKKEFSINCVDPLNRSALVSAIENEHFELIQLLLEEGIEVGDALLHAISEEYVEAVEELLQWEERNHEKGTPYSWEAVDRSKSNFTPDITPIILAAHCNNYEICKILLDRGAALPMPHDVKCGCDDCIKSQESDSLRHSQSRINAYRALSASSMIALSSRDPVLTAFELSYELKYLQTVESEFRREYTEMRVKIQDFVSSLLDHARTSTELEIILNYNHEATAADIWMPGQRQTLERLKLAIKYKQKTFVAHPNVQQLLAAIWFDGLPGFRRKTAIKQIIQVGQMGCSFPIYSMHYILAPNSEKAKFMRKPFVQFIMHSTSYMFFLMLLAGSSLRIIPFLFETIGFQWMLDILDDWRKHERGSLPGPIELGIIMYIGSLIFGEIKTLYNEGLMEYICDLWNIVDFISNMFYVTWILMRATSWIITHRDLWYRNINPYFPREHWHPFDPMLLAEGAFAAATIFSFLKLIHIFSINPHLGPLQVSLGRMIIDIIKFFFIYTLVLFAFGCGLNQLLWYYAEMEMRKCYHLHRDVPDFDDQEKACTIWRRFANLFETSQSLFWASFGLVDLVSFDLAGIKGFTRFWALLLFGSYSVINIIVLLNMLIAMMSNSYQVIYEKSDTEWKFARSQLWMSYFEDGNTLPPPFNICPTMKMIQNVLGKTKRRTTSVIRRAKEKAQLLHDRVVRLLVRRYVTAEQRKREDNVITEDDIIEVKADISSFRYELLDIFQKNKMIVPELEQQKQSSQGTKKGKILERRVMKDFQIGFVQHIAEEMSKEGKDIFSTIADIIGRKKGGSKDKDTDWNALVRKRTVSSNPIGSKKSSMIRRSERSLRRKMIEDANAGWSTINDEKLVELNPKLSEVTQTTRVAYVKFMQKSQTKREQLKDMIGSPESNKNDKPETQQEKEAILAAKLKSSLKRGFTSTSDVTKSNSGQRPEAPVVPVLTPASEKPKIADRPTNVSADKVEAPKSDKENSKSNVKSDTSENKKEKLLRSIKKDAPSIKGDASSVKTEEKSDPSKLKEATEVKGKAPEVPSNLDNNKTIEKAAPKQNETQSGSDSKSSSTGSSGEVKKMTSATADKAETKPGTSSASSGPANSTTSSKTTSAGPTKTSDPKSDDKKSEDKKSVEKKSGKTDKDKKEDQAKMNLAQQGAQSGAAGDRGKSTVTGRVISGWL